MLGFEVIKKTKPKQKHHQNQTNKKTQTQKIPSKSNFPVPDSIKSNSGQFLWSCNLCHTGKPRPRLSIEATSKDSMKVFKAAYHHIGSKEFSCPYSNFPQYCFGFSVCHLSLRPSNAGNHPSFTNATEAHDFLYKLVRRKWFFTGWDQQCLAFYKIWRISSLPQGVHSLVQTEPTCFRYDLWGHGSMRSLSPCDLQLYILILFSYYSYLKGSFGRKKK